MQRDTQTNAASMKTETSSGLSRPLTALPLTLRTMSPGKMRPDICSHARDFRACFTFEELLSRQKSTHVEVHTSVHNLPNVSRSRKRTLPVLPVFHVGADAQADTNPRRCNTKRNLGEPTLLEPPDHPIFPQRIALECEPQTRRRSSTCTRQLLCQFQHPLSHQQQ